MNNKIIKLLKNMISDDDEYFDEGVARNILSRLSKDEVETDVSHSLRLEKLKVNLWGMILHYNYDAFSNAEDLKNNTYFKSETIKKWESLFNEFGFNTKLLFNINISTNAQDNIITSDNINFFNALGTVEYKNPWFEKAHEIGLDKFSKEEILYLGMSLISDGSTGKSTSHIRPEILLKNLPKVVTCIDAYFKSLPKKKEMTDLLLTSEFVRQIAYNDDLFDGIKELFVNINKSHVFKSGDITENILKRMYLFNKIKQLFPPEDWLDLFVENGELNLKNMFMKKIQKLEVTNHSLLNKEFLYYAPALKKYNISESNLTVLYIIIMNTEKHGDLFKQIYKTLGMPEFSKTTTKLYEKLNINSNVKLSEVDEKMSYLNIIKFADHEKIAEEINKNIPLNNNKPSKIKL